MEAIGHAECPRTKKLVCSFLGLVGWYSRFVHQFTTLAIPLQTPTIKVCQIVLRGPDNANKRLMPSNRHIICSSPVLCSPTFQRCFNVQVDASDIGIGVALVQGDEGEERPLLYLSRKLLPRESTIEKKCLVINGHWKAYSITYSEKSLTSRPNLEDHIMKDNNARVMRWYLSLQPSNFLIQPKAGQPAGRLPFTVC